MTQFDDVSSVSPGRALRDRVSEDVKSAMKAHDASLVATLRCIMAALDNATAVPIIAAHVRTVGRLADVPRHELTAQQVSDLLHAEMASREKASALCRGSGELTHAERLESEVVILRGYLKTVPHE